MNSNTNTNMAARGAGAAQRDQSHQTAASTLALQPTTTDINMANNHLMSILSARKYPDPTTPDTYGNSSDYNLLQSLSFGFDVDHESSSGLYGAGAQGLDYLMNAHDPQHTFILEDQSTPLPVGKTTASKRRAGDDGQGPKERRKKQIREAQRAYRLRKESRISFLTSRVSELEKVIEDMSTTVATFSDSLLESGVLAPHANLTQCTRQTLEKCLRLAKTTNSDDERESSSSQSEKQAAQNQEADLTIDLLGHPRSGLEHYMQPVPAQPLTPPPSTEGSQPVLQLQCSAFMDQLHMAILYRGYLTLTDPSVPAEGVRQKFRLLYPVMGRGNLAAYFAAALHARISKNELAKQWKSVPFFQLGGAGTHYAWPPELGPYTRRSRHWQAVSVPLSHFSSDIQEHLNGDWFDMQDLECFLMEKKIKLVAAAGTADPPPSDAQQTQTHVHAKKLISALLNKAVCLGRSAGFRRSDVETALSKAVLV